MRLRPAGQFPGQRSTRRHGHFDRTARLNPDVCETLEARHLLIVLHGTTPASARLPLGPVAVDGGEVRTVAEVVFHAGIMQRARPFGKPRCRIVVARPA